MRSEVAMLRAAGGRFQFDPIHGGYMMEDERCVKLTPDFKCELHGLPEQPFCCRDNKVGEEFCLTVRKAVGLQIE